MKKYIFLIVCSLVLIICVAQIPDISNQLAKECVAVSVVNSTATESVFCKGIIEQEYDTYIVRIQISEEDISKVSIGNQVKVICKALGDKMLLGKLKTLSDFAYKIIYGGVSLTVVDAVVEFDEIYDELKSGYTATAEIIYTKIEGAVILPFEGVAKEKNGKYYVYRIDENWAVKEYVNIAFEDEKGAVVFGECNINTICENPESLSGDYVRIKNAWND